jgi:hypothetical protein
MLPSNVVPSMITKSGGFAVQTESIVRGDRFRGLAAGACEEIAKGHLRSRSPHPFRSANGCVDKAT